MDDFMSMMKKMSQQMTQGSGNVEEQKQKLEAMLLNIKSSGESGAGMVKCSMNGKFELSALSIDESLIKENDGSFLEDLIVAAVNTASRKVQKEVQQQTSSMMLNNPMSALGSIDQNQLKNLGASLGLDLNNIGDLLGSKK